jgi:hypothetical protein
MFDQYLEEEKIEPPMRVYIKHFTTDLEISENKIKRAESSEIIQEPDWGKIVFDFIDQKIKTLPEYNELIQIIVNEYKENINTLAKDSDEKKQSALWLKTFMQKLIYNKLDSKLTEDTIIEYASLFKSELELSKLEYSYSCFLEGLFIEPDSISITSNCHIRKIQRSDFEYKKDIFLDIPSHFSYSQSSVLEIKLSAEDEQECWNYIERIQNCLRLYKLCSVYFTYAKCSKKTIIWPTDQHIAKNNRNYTANYKYTVNDLEIDKFIKFVNLILERLNFDVDMKENRTLFISIDRYNQALMELLDIDRKIMAAIMGLEALFTFEKDRGENTFKLGIRAAKLLNNLGFEPFKVRELIEEGYHFRNMVVHGSYISENNRKRMQEILPNIINYLRVALIVFLMNKDMGKEGMIEFLEKSMINDDQNKLLIEKLKMNIEEFPNVFS